MKNRIVRKFVCVDVGSTKICSSISTIKNNEIHILDFQTSKCDGISKGIIKNFSLLESYISSSIEKLEKKSGESIKSAFVNISGKDLQYAKVSSKISLQKKPIQKKDISKLINTIKVNSDDIKILHIIPISYSLDNVSGIKDPIGMVGNYLTVTAIVIFIPKSIFKNLLFAFEKSHIDVLGTVATPLASGLGTLTVEEMNNGAIVVDIGGSLSTVSYFYEGTMQEFKVFPFGGVNITKDIAYALDISITDAERLKTLYGKVFKSIMDDKEFVLIPKENDNLINLRQVSKSEIINAIEPRVTEMFEIMSDYIKKIKSPNIILVGQTSVMPGINDLARNIFKKQIKKVNISPENYPSHVNLGIMNFVNTYWKSESESEGKPYKNDNLFHNIINWLNENF